MKICSTKDKNKEAVELPNVRDLERFKEIWISQGGKIKHENKELGSLTLINSSGDEIFCIVLDDMIFPFKFGGE